MVALSWAALILVAAGASALTSFACKCASRAATPPRDASAAPPVARAARAWRPSECAAAPAANTGVYVGPSLRGKLGLFARAGTRYARDEVIASFGKVRVVFENQLTTDEQWTGYEVQIPADLVDLHLTHCSGRKMLLIPDADFKAYRAESAWPDGREKGALCNAPMRGETIDALLEVVFADGVWSVRLIATRNLTLREARELLVDYGADYQRLLELEIKLRAVRSNTNENRYCARCNKGYTMKQSPQHMHGKKNRPSSPAR
jgi:hypothetical protein